MVAIVELSFTFSCTKIGIESVRSSCSQAETIESIEGGVDFSHSKRVYKWINDGFECDESVDDKA